MVNSILQVVKNYSDLQLYKAPAVTLMKSVRCCMTRRSRNTLTRL